MPFSITKEDYITDMARSMADIDNRSVSNYIETLVKRDHFKYETSKTNDKKEK